MIAIEGDAVAVGVRDDDHAVNDEKVFLFERDDAGTPANPWDDQWVETAAIPSALRSRFGWGLDISSDTLFVGARWYDLTANDDNSGVVFVYFRDDQGTPGDRMDDTWYAGPMLSANVLVLGGQYGRSVEVSEDTLLVGAWKALGSGAAYVLERDRKGTSSPADDEWIETGLLRPSDGRGGDGFGNGLSLSTDVCVVGSLAHDMPTQTNIGKVYVYERDDMGTPSDPFDDEGPETARLIPSQAGGGDQTANRLSVWGGLAAVGALNGEVVHVFDLDGLLRFHVETADDWTTPLPNESVVSTAIGFGNWLRIEGHSASGLEAAAFDSSFRGPNLPGSDPDLLVGTVNVLILQENAAQSVAGTYDVPDDDRCGGNIEIEFLEGVARPLSVNLVDIDPFPNQEAILTLFDRFGATRTYFVPAGWTEDVVTHGLPGYRTLDLTTLAPQPGYLATATATDSPGFSPTEVVRLRVQFMGSAALDDLCWSVNGSTMGRYGRGMYRGCAGPASAVLVDRSVRRRRALRSRSARRVPIRRESIRRVPSGASAGPGRP
jgi:hypothetical protein